MCQRIKRQKQKYGFRESRKKAYEHNSKVQPPSIPYSTDTPHGRTGRVIQLSASSAYHVGELAICALVLPVVRRHVIAPCRRVRRPLRAGRLHLWLLFVFADALEGTAGRLLVVADALLERFQVDARLQGAHRNRRRRFPVALPQSAREAATAGGNGNAAGLLVPATTGAAALGSRYTTLERPREPSQRAPSAYRLRLCRTRGYSRTKKSLSYTKLQESQEELVD